MSGLYGIKYSNRKDNEHWGKNCFNSSFPASLACYMMNKNIKAVYAKLARKNSKLEVVCDEIDIRELFNCGKLTTDEIEFDFESRFEPYSDFSFSSIDGIDLVTKDLEGNFLAPIEIKLTVLPTSATASKPEKDWGTEIVIRSATTSYIALSIWNEVKAQSTKVRNIFEPVCSAIGDWKNNYEMSHKTITLCSALDEFESYFIDFQRPLVMQPFWKTKGQSPVLCDEAFDIVVWSNLAFSRLFIDSSKIVADEMSRPMRASAKMARCLWELSKSGKIQIQQIYREMAFGNQTDKELAVPGDKWREYITTDRTVHPSVPLSAIKEIIPPECINNLRPERRFDQTLYFMYQNKLS